MAKYPLKIKYRYLWAIYGIILSAGAPIGYWLLEKVLVPEIVSLEKFTYLYLWAATSIVFSIFGFFAGKNMGQINYLSTHDQLTGLFNRRYLMDKFPEQLSLGKKLEKPSTVLMLDLDHFKGVNDRYGHLAGDEILKATAKSIRDNIRSTDTCARFGGEEFIILCPNTSKKEGFALAERIRTTVENINIKDLGLKEKQTISIGLKSTELNRDLNQTEIISQADEALYRAKNSGRNKTIAI